MAAYPFSAAHGCNEPQLVEAIIHARLGALDHRANLIAHLGQQRQRQKTMRNGATVRGLTGGPHRVNVNEILVMRELGELVDHGLIDRDPVRYPEIGADSSAHVIERDFGSGVKCIHQCLPAGALRHLAALFRARPRVAC